MRRPAGWPCRPRQARDATPAAAAGTSRGRQESCGQSSHRAPASEGARRRVAFAPAGSNGRMKPCGRAAGMLQIGPRDETGRRPVTLAQRSEEHTSELQSLMRTSYDVFCLKKKTKYTHNN